MFISSSVVALSHSMPNSSFKITKGAADSQAHLRSMEAASIPPHQVLLQSLHKPRGQKQNQLTCLLHQTEISSYKQKQKKPQKQRTCAVMGEQAAEAEVAVAAPVE